MNISNHVAAFKEARKADGLQNRTLQDYNRVLDPFTTWCEEGNIILIDLNKDIIRKYVCTLMGNNWSNGTLSIYVRVLRTFLNWIHTDGRVNKNLAKCIKPPKEHTRLEDLPTEQELIDILLTCQGYKQAERDKALILFLLDTGLRVGEMVLLKRSQLHLDVNTNTMYLNAKTPKTHDNHYIFLGLETTRVMTDYLETRIDNIPELWVGLRGPLTSLGIYKLLKRRAKKAGIETSRIHPHAFRKLFATLWINNGGDTITLKRLGNWKTDTMLERYVLLAGRQNLANLHKKFSPVDNLLE